MATPTPKRKKRFTADKDNYASNEPQQRWPRSASASTKRLNSFYRR
jgi:hypothetical protein